MSGLVEVRRKNTFGIVRDEVGGEVEVNAMGGALATEGAPASNADTATRTSVHAAVAVWPVVADETVFGGRAFAGIHDAEHRVEVDKRHGEGNWYERRPSRLRSQTIKLVG